MVLQKQRRPAAFQLAFGHDRHAVAEHVRLVHVVRREKERAALFCLGEQIPQLPSSESVHARSRLVQKHKLRPPAQRHRRRELAPHAAGELVGEVVGSGGKVELGQEMRNFRLGLVFKRRQTTRLQTGEQLEVLARRQQVEEDVVLGAESRDTTDRIHLVSDPPPIDDRAAVGASRVRREEARENVDGGRLARAVVAEQRKDVALKQLEGEVVEGDEAAESLA
mmetsp:Transcript_11012/g.38908  ORF Transcript_11012/g.38908 Transcript_11012/m.38908 type:complete len:223 (-) Transcript_11012:1269-1937(-)